MIRLNGRNIQYLIFRVYMRTQKRKKILNFSLSKFLITHGALVSKETNLKKCDFRVIVMDMLGKYCSIQKNIKIVNPCTIC